MNAGTRFFEARVIKKFFMNAEVLRARSLILSPPIVYIYVKYFCHSGIKRKILIKYLLIIQIKN